jgi:hypothetical protein
MVLRCKPVASAISAIVIRRPNCFSLSFQKANSVLLTILNPYSDIINTLLTFSPIYGNIVFAKTLDEAQHNTTVIIFPIFGKSDRANSFVQRLGRLEQSWPFCFPENRRAARCSEHLNGSSKTESRFLKCIHSILSLHAYLCKIPNLKCKLNTPPACASLVNLVPTAAIVPAVEAITRTALDSFRCMPVGACAVWWRRR